MEILVDDKRDSVTGIICRDIESAKFVLLMLSRHSLMDLADAPCTLFLDHDMGKGYGHDGIDLLKWAVANDIQLPRMVVLVSDNPVGCKNMHDALVFDLKYRSDHSRRIFIRG